MKLVNQTGVEAGFDVWPIPTGRTFADAAAFVAEEHALAEAGKPFRNPYTFFTDGGPSLRMALTKDATEDVSTTLGPGMLVIVCLRFHPSLNEDRPSGVAGPITLRLQEEFFALTSGRKPDRHNWLTPVNAPVGAASR